MEYVPLLYPKQEAWAPELSLWTVLWVQRGGSLPCAASEAHRPSPPWRTVCQVRGPRRAASSVLPGQLHGDKLHDRWPREDTREGGPLAWLLGISIWKLLISEEEVAKRGSSWVSAGTSKATIRDTYNHPMKSIPHPS